MKIKVKAKRWWSRKDRKKARAMEGLVNWLIEHPEEVIKIAKMVGYNK